MQPEILEAGAACVNNLPEIAGYVVGGLVIVASTAANFISKDTIIGKVINWVALNIKVEKRK